MTFKKKTQNNGKRQFQPGNKRQISTATFPINEDSNITQDSTEGQSSATIVSDTAQNKCIRTTSYPLHVISTSIPPDPIETWPDKQSLDDSPKGMTRVPSEKIKTGMPKSLVVFKDDKGRERTLVPVCQRLKRLVMR
jgi:hypothetical protein